MKLARLAIVGCAAALAVLDAQAAGHRGGFVGGGHFVGGHAVVHPHFHSRVFIGGTFFVSPFPYYYGPAYYYPPAVVAAPPPQQYWYYCPPAAAYYPYVQYCPAGWQLVMPSAPPPGPY
jgi:hypothetical protein